MKLIDLASLAGAVLAIGAITALREWWHFTNQTTIALCYLMVVLISATVSRLWIAVLASVLADLCLNFFFMPPVGTFTIADPQNWVALFVFLAVSLVAGNLSATARARTREALARRDEIARLFDLSRDVLMTTDSGEAIAQLAGFIAGRFDLDFAALCLPRAGDWRVFEAGPAAITLEEEQLTRAFEAANAGTQSGPGARADAGHRLVERDGRNVHLVPLRHGANTVGLLAAAGRPVEPGALDTLAGVAAIAIERAQFLDDRKRAELARQSEELKSALLASLSHDLRTPLTTIRVAASNLRASWLAVSDRQDQSDLILTEVERLNRLFQNILEMARIDAGAVAADVRWVHPSEIFEAARDQVEHTIRYHSLDVASNAEELVRLDPRLTASALAHLLENAAQYTPPGSSIAVNISVIPDGLEITVRDHGQGIDPADLPHVFDRFYRGRAAPRRISGTGMGLSIARGLLAAERGSIAVENCPDGGARFTIVVPAATKRAAAAEQT
jgi:two-component system sensor histidine kinase KdpD